MFLRYLMIILMVWVRYFTWSFKRKKKKAFLTSLKAVLIWKKTSWSKVQFSSWFKTISQKCLLLLFKQVGPSSKLWPGRYTTAVWGASSSFQLVRNGISWITCVVSELKHCVEHKNGRNMELMSFTEEEPWWVLHWASLLPAEEWGLNLFFYILITNRWPS